MTKKWMLFVAVMSGSLLVASSGEKKQAADKVEIRHSMLGYRDTLVFYSYPDAPAILVLQIGNEDESFPMKGTVHLFEKATPEEGLKKWINNQHSDALHIDAAKPVFTKKLSDDFYKVGAKKQMETRENPGPNGGVFVDYQISFSIQEQVIHERFALPAFTDTARVYVKSK